MSNQKQRIKINNVFSSWKDLILGVPQGSALDFCFSTFTLRFILLPEGVDIRNFADEGLKVISGETLQNVLKSLEKKFYSCYTLV